VRESSHEFCFEIEPFDKVSVGSVPWWQYFNCHLAFKAFLVGSIDTSHPSLTEWGKNAIVA
jgi:hypothetical protein